MSRLTAGLTAAGLLLLLPAAAAASSLSARKKLEYDPLIKSISYEYGLEADFVHAVIKAESAYNRYAISKAGARGLMQLMPATAAAYGVKDIFDAEDNIRGGVKFLKKLLTQYNGNKRLTLAAYNAGQEALKKHDGKVPPYPETHTYINRVMTSLKKTETSGRTKIYEYRDEKGRLCATDDPRKAAQYGVIDPD